MPSRIGQVPGRAATYTEIITQVDAWEEAVTVVNGHSYELTRLCPPGRYTQVIFTGCGSTYYLALAAAALFQQLTGVPARGVPAGELVMYPDSTYTAQRQELLVALSRSAETSETLAAVRAFQNDRRGKVIAITNYGDRSLAGATDLSFAIPAGQEESIAQTRSFASMYVAATALACIVAARNDLTAAMYRLAPAGHQLIERYADLAQRLGSRLDIERFYILGSGPRYGLACEISLKMKEMALTHSEPFHFLEFRHGPISMASSGALVVGLLSEARRSYEAAVLTDAAKSGAATLRFGEFDADVMFSSQVPEPVRNVLYLPMLQLLAYHRAVAKGLDPDRPHNLSAVVTLGLDFGAVSDPSSRATGAHDNGGLS